MSRRAFAIAAHPDDIEFMMSGTLMLLAEAGYEIHYMTVANGSCGTTQYDTPTIIRMRREESIAAANSIGAIYHDALVDDLEVFFDKCTLRRLGAIMRDVAPEIILTQSPGEYMEDHANTCRLVLTAAFARGMPNFPTDPPTPTTDQPVTVYHALPYGLRDPLRRRVRPGMYVDITETVDRKREMLACHRSQKEWLDESQGLDSYLNTMTEMSRQVGGMSGGFEYAEGWVRHLPLGFCGEDDNPLRDALGERCRIDEEFERGLD
jgi:N-acetylglucosamine malate deacetylase 1